MRPARWDLVTEKFKRLAAPLASEGLDREIIARVQSLESVDPSDLLSLLAEVRVPEDRLPIP